MACSDNQQPDFKHFCRICKKGFMCGRALGGHMRAHGVGDEIMNLDDEDQTNAGEGNKRMYALRTNPNRFSRVCENCGKEFFSWKAFLEHGKCSSDDAESSLVWSQESEADDDEDGDAYGYGYHGGGGWSKRKRSFRVCQSSEDEEDVALAKCLMALSNTKVVENRSDGRVCATTNKEEERQNTRFSSEFLSNFTKPSPPLNKAKGVMATPAATTPKGMFECKACKKVFNSHQALGGHRASHKNVKGCFASRNDQFDDNLADEDTIIHDDYKPINPYQLDHGPNTLSGRKSKAHKCTICNRIFASGQALGGHKRCHWLTSNYTSDTPISKLNFHEHIEQLHQRAQAVPKELKLNLNLSDSSKTRKETQNPTSLEVSTEINLHVAHKDNVDADAKEDRKHQSNNNNGNQDDHIVATTLSKENVDDENQSKAKFAKLSELKDMSINNGSSSSWLQVGIGSNDVSPNP